MKRIAFCCLFAALLANGFGQTMQEINARFNNCGICVGGWTDEISYRTIPFSVNITGIDTIHFITFKYCEEDVTPILQEILNEKPFSDYEKALSGMVDGHKMEVLLHHKGEIIDELIIVQMNKIPYFMRIQGNLKKKDVEAYIEKSKNESGAF